MLKDLLRPWKFRATCLPWRIAAASGLWQGEGPPVQFVTEKADWSIRWDGEHIRDTINAITGTNVIATTAAPQSLTRRVVHFGSQYMWLDWGQHMASHNQYVATFFHGKAEDGPEVSAHIDRFLSSVPRLSRVITAASLIEKRLLEWGVPAGKLVRIPIGVDTQTFSPPTAKQRATARSRFGLMDDQVVVGSFQKDGIGWGDGMEPKRIKGPDVLVDAVIKLAQHRPVTVFLTGPARGYVKRRLEAAEIPFVHTYVKNHMDLVNCYHALDLYFVTSREEGGPKGIMEGMATGVPVVSTNVGMASDLIIDGITGGLTDSENVDGLVQRAAALLELPDRASALRIAAREAVMVADWSVVGRDHWLKVYQPLLQS
ncbi:MAG: glycosyltransferase [Rhodospirillaceae bacterium]|nr:glycosyltransferase [Rhodospirillaceae bacterium]